jgi:hypothetical protein
MNVGGGQEVKQMFCGCWDKRVVPLRDKHVVCVRWSPFVGWALFVLPPTGNTITGKPADSKSATHRTAAFKDAQQIPLQSRWAALG